MEETKCKRCGHEINKHDPGKTMFSSNNSKCDICEECYPPDTGLVSLEKAAWIWEETLRINRISFRKEEKK